MNPFSRRGSKRKSTRKPSARRRYFERLETRSLLTTFTVLNTHDRGSGSLRQAIIDSNFHLGADTIAGAHGSWMHRRTTPHANVLAILRLLLRRRGWRPPQPSEQQIAYRRELAGQAIVELEE